ncbi:hypothetical protein BJG93_24730 [Paraburkholderia sprentiae WSM5005]|uniref:Uncharacterized protein n=1 Tax=Paraburkholderia sprentiae WSM5005 TaxID=754502 RepID=A0A1I9YQT0_9BURK|nr:hypothetical protein [Paraburkholderia sprentiae]APA88552.1 hypothetical protein BJG93_24730 [Paraburkholderia sprentiae WSM5005]
MRRFALILLVLVVAMLAARTVIHIEGNANAVNGIEGHTGTAKVPSTFATAHNPNNRQWSGICL